MAGAVEEGGLLNLWNCIHGLQFMGLDPWIEFCWVRKGVQVDSYFFFLI